MGTAASPIRDVAGHAADVACFFPSSNESAGTSLSAGSRVGQTRDDFGGHHGGLEEQDQHVLGVRKERTAVPGAPDGPDPHLAKESCRFVEGSSSVRNGVLVKPAVIDGRISLCLSFPSRTERPINGHFGTGLEQRSETRESDSGLSLLARARRTM